jgi:hypothetical protein
MHIRTLLFIPLVAACAALLTAGAAQAQQPQAKVSENKAERSRGAGADQNVKADRAPNHVSATAAPAPAAKGGERTRGGVSVVHIDNWTQWYIDVYMNGTFCGSMGPWGDTYCYVPSGNVTMYARAPFDDGSALKWGPRVDYVDGTYTWKLNP